MFRIKPWLNFSAGALLGYLVVHPMIMLAADLMPVSASYADYWTLDRLGATVQRAFHLAMLPWGLGFALLCALAGWLLARARQASLREQKLQGVADISDFIKNAMIRFVNSRSYPQPG